MSQLPPIPVTPLYATYISPSVSRRPGLITAIGVISIVVASLAIIGNLILLFYVLMFNVFVSATTRYGSAGSTTSPSSTVASAAIPPKSVPTAAEYVAPNGFSAADRRVVISALSTVRPLSSARQEQLDALLADAGQQIIPQSGNDLTPAAVVADVSESSGMPDGSGGPPIDVFRCGTGRLQVSDGNAVFYPAGNQPAVRVAGNAADAQGHVALGTDQVDAIVSRVQLLTNDRANPMQIQTLTAKLNEPGQTLIASSASVAGAAAQIVGTYVQPDGGISFRTPQGTWTLGPSGEFVPGFAASTGSTPYSGAFRMATSRGALLTIFVELMGSLALAALLLTAGIFTLRNSLYARRMLLIHASLRIGLAAAGAAGWYVLLQRTTANGNAAGMSAVITAAFLAGIIPAIFPVAILIALSSKTARDFFNTDAAVLR